MNPSEMEAKAIAVKTPGEASRAADAPEVEKEDYVVVLEDVSKDFAVRGQSTPVHALKGVNMKVPRGALVAVKGESGSGKTTLLQIVGALDVPTDGVVFVGDRDISAMSESELTNHRAKTVGFIFQNFNLIPNLSALENVELPMEALDRPTAERRRAAVDLLTTVGMEHRMDYKPMKLSGGEQQRVAIARALANDPTIVLADEPTGNLDSKTGASIVELLNKLRTERGTTIIMVTHSEEAARAADFAYIISDGAITNKKDLGEEFEMASRKKALREELAVTAGIASRLFSAGYDDVDTIDDRDLADLTEVVGDEKQAKKIIRNAERARKKRDRQ
ncbi:MAG: ABC transporter ATP-binding protein [Methanobacteriota archaeon]